MRKLIAQSSIEIDSKQITTEKFEKIIELLKDECKNKVIEKNDYNTMLKQPLPEIEWEETEKGLKFVFSLYMIEREELDNE